MSEDENAKLEKPPGAEKAVRKEVKEMAEATTMDGKHRNSYRTGRRSCPHRPDRGSHDPSDVERLSAKQTSVNPNFAGLIVHFLNGFDWTSRTGSDPAALAWITTT